MMCEQIQELILTDYSDNQLSPERRKEVDDHMIKCASCRDFAAVVSEKIFTPFDEVAPIEPPDSIWQAIKEEIDEEETSPQWDFSDILKWFRQLNVLHQPVFQVTLVALLVTTTIFSVSALRHSSSSKIIHQQAMHKDSVIDQDATIQESNLAFLVDEIDTNGREFNGYGTDIEDYFL